MAEFNSTLTGRWTMMTSSNGNILRVTGPLCGKFTGHKFPAQRPGDAELWCFLWSTPWINGWVNNRAWGWCFGTPSRSLLRHCDDTQNGQQNPKGSPRVENDEIHRRFSTPHMYIRYIRTYRLCGPKCIYIISSIASIDKGCETLYLLIYIDHVSVHSNQSLLIIRHFFGRNEMKQPPLRPWPFTYPVYLMQW